MSEGLSPEMRARIADRQNAQAERLSRDDRLLQEYRARTATLIADAKIIGTAALEAAVPFNFIGKEYEEVPKRFLRPKEPPKARIVFEGWSLARDDAKDSAQPAHRRRIETVIGENAVLYAVYHAGNDEGGWGTGYDKPTSFEGLPASRIGGLAQSNVLLSLPKRIKEEDVESWWIIDEVVSPFAPFNLDTAERGLAEFASRYDLA